MAHKVKTTTPSKAAEGASGAARKLKRQQERPAVAGRGRPSWPPVLVLLRRDQYPARRRELLAHVGSVVRIEAPSRFDQLGEQHRRQFRRRTRDGGGPTQSPSTSDGLAEGPLRGSRERAAFPSLNHRAPRVSALDCFRVGHGLALAAIQWADFPPTLRHDALESVARLQRVLDAAQADLPHSRPAASQRQPGAGYQHPAPNRG